MWPFNLQSSSKLLFFLATLLSVVQVGKKRKLKSTCSGP